MTLKKKCPPPPHIKFNEPLPGDLTPRASQIQNRGKQVIECPGM